MLGLPLSFTSPFLLTALLLLPVIWWLLRLMPPRPVAQIFPPTRLLAEIEKKEDTPDKSPWWLTLLRLSMAGLAIIALAGPFWNAKDNLQTSNNPLVLIVDNGWSAAHDWLDRAQTARSILETAEQAGRPVALVLTADLPNAEVRLDEPTQALERFSAAQPQPYPENRQLAAERIEKAVGIEDAQILWIASRLASPEDQEFASKLQEIGNVSIRHQADSVMAILDARNDAGEMNIDVKKLPLPGPNAILRALDEDGLPISEIPVTFDEEEDETTLSIGLPIELRNQITQLSLVSESGESFANAGAIYLIDDQSKRRKVGLISGQSADLSQPLLSPLYYINRALEPFADLREAQTPNLAEAIPDLLQANISILVMADVGTLPDAERQSLREFMQNGGTVVRFAGPRLASTNDSLTPVTLRAGERNLGGSLTWEQPQKLARFSQNSPFTGMEVPDDIEVTRQVLAEPDFDLLQKTWAELADGTPLVTADRIGDGWLVLFHVAADATWSNLPISGTFVEMLNKMVAFSSVPVNAAVSEQSGDAPVLPPFQTVDASGRLGPPAPSAEPIAVETLNSIKATAKSPPGYYGRQTSLIAHNLMDNSSDLKALGPAELFPTASIAELGGETATDLRGLFFTLMMLFLMADAVIVCFISGVFSNALLRTATRTASVPLMAIMLSLPFINKTSAQTDDIAGFEAALTTRLAYVITGDGSLDDMSKAGLIGLTHFLSRRTALEPGEPVGLNIEVDELAFYPLLYWPLSPQSTIPNAATMARIDAFMKQGGTVLFDTRDQSEAGFGGTPEATLKLREIVASLDVPPLEPVPANHVLTRAFYLLQDFPGRWSGSPLWVEATPDNENATEESLSQADGVSSILITANDFASAWAVDDGFQPILPTVPSDPRQRTYSYRTGVNIVMYTLTGNYKADQVHIPALLERLGQ